MLTDIASEFGELRGARPAWRGQIGTESRKTCILINCSSVSSIGMPPPGSFPPPVPPPGALPPGIPPAMPPPPMPPGAGGHGPPAAGTPGAGHPGHGHSHPHPFPPGGIPHPGEYSAGKGRDELGRGAVTTYAAVLCPSTIIVPELSFRHSFIKTNTRNFTLFKNYHLVSISYLFFQSV